METRKKSDTSLLKKDEIIKTKSTGNSSENIDEDPDGRLVFYGIITVTQALGAACVALAIALALKYSGGYRWDGSGNTSNYHVLFMTLGMIVLLGNCK